MTKIPYTVIESIEDVIDVNLLDTEDNEINPATEETVDTIIAVSDEEQIDDHTDTADDWISLDLGDVRTAVEIAVDVSGEATLTIQVSSTGDFNGEEFEVRNISYDDAGVSLEQFDFRYQYVRCQVDNNLNNLEMVARGG